MIKKILIQKDTCIPMFIAALFIIAKIWKQPKCSLTDKWIKKTSYIYTMENYSDMKKEWNNDIFSNMDRHRNYNNKWSKSDRERHIIWYFLYVESKIQREHIYKSETDSQT